MIFCEVASRASIDAPTTTAPSALPGETRQALISTLPAETITGMPAARSCATAESSCRMCVDVSAMNDQFATAGRRGCSLWSWMTHAVPSTMAA